MSKVIMPREHLHSRYCLAAAMIAAIENLRDQEADVPESTLDHSFRLDVQDGTPLVWADEYLASGTVDCRCSPASQIRTLVAMHDTRERGYAMAREYHNAGMLSDEQYRDLTR